MSPNDSDGMANSVDPDQTALGAVWSGSALFAQAYLSERIIMIIMGYNFCSLLGIYNFRYISHGIMDT